MSIRSSHGDKSAAYEICARITEGTFSLANNFSTPNESDVKKSAPHASLAKKRVDCRALANAKLIKSFPSSHILSSFHLFRGALQTNCFLPLSILFGKGFIANRFIRRSPSFGIAE